MTENVSAAQPAKAPAAKFGGKGLTIAIAVAAIVTVAGLALWGGGRPGRGVRWRPGGDGAFSATRPATGPFAWGCRPF